MTDIPFLQRARIGLNVELQGQGRQAATFEQLNFFR
jgi:hypothetical protein